MPWIVVTPTPSVTQTQADALATRAASVAAAALNLQPADVIVLVASTQAAAGTGAHVAITGRRRSEDAEERLASDIRDVVAQALSLSPDLVGLTRSGD